MPTNLLNSMNSAKDALTTVGAVSTNNRSITFTGEPSKRRDLLPRDDAYIYDWTGPISPKAGGKGDLDVDDTVWVYTEFDTNSQYVKYVFLKVDASEGVVLLMLTASRK